MGLWGEDTVHVDMVVALVYLGLVSCQDCVAQVIPGTNGGLFSTNGDAELWIT